MVVGVVVMVVVMMLTMMLMIMMITYKDYTDPPGGKRIRIPSAIASLVSR